MTDSLTRAGLRRMEPRDRGEDHRAASPLELLFDLVFVVAVSQASHTLSVLLSGGNVWSSVLSYLMVFFAIWWAWVNFTWFASAFDTDDWAYRAMTILQMVGVLVLAAGVHDAMTENDYAVVTWGYVIMRLAMVGQWLRAGLSDPGSRRTAFAFAGGIAVVQVLWVARMLVLDASWQFITFFVLMVCEMLVPVFAERQGRTHWHPHHIAERYGLFTLILLGESILASATAVIAAINEGSHLGELYAIALGGLVIAAGMWWVYFSRDQGERLATGNKGLVFGYVHYIIFAAAGAVSAGIEVAINHTLGHTELSHAAVGLSLSLPVGVFVLAVWALLLRELITRRSSVAIAALGILIVASAALPTGPVAAIAILLVVVVVVLEVDAFRTRRQDAF